MWIATQHRAFRLNSLGFCRHIRGLFVVYVIRRYCTRPFGELYDAAVCTSKKAAAATIVVDVTALLAMLLF